MFCEHCGKEFSKNAAYCDQCGTKFVVTEEKAQSIQQGSYSLKTIFFSFVISGIVSGIFLAVALFIIDSVVSSDNGMDLNARLWTIVLVFGALTSIFPFIRKQSSLVKLASYFLRAYWILGTLLAISIVLLSDNTQEAEEAPAEEEIGFECTRDNPYKMPEEFKRALSLRKQRLLESGYTSIVDREEEYKNCLNIQYGDLRLNGGAEGVFWFDDSVSDANNLRITVDNVYRFNDDLLLAVLLQHEMWHVKQFIEKNTALGNELSCLDLEADAFQSELDFIKILNKGELESVVSRFAGYKKGQMLNEHSENFFGGLETIFFASKYASEVCNARIAVGTSKKEDLRECKHSMESTQIRRMLEEYNYCEKE